MDNDKEVQLFVQELQNRIGQITSQYETQLAMVKAQANVKIEELQEQIKALQKESDLDG